MYSPLGQGHVPQDEEREGCRDEFVRGLRLSSSSQLGLRRIVFVI
jgi:hypothetical protein